MLGQSATRLVYDNGPFFRKPDLQNNMGLLNSIFTNAKFRKTCGVVWASPNTAIGVGLGVLALLTGGQMQLRRGCLEFHGGVIRWWLSRLLAGQGAAAMTLGHTIVGQSPAMLCAARDHEHVHVRQYERWGPLFLPLYLGYSLRLWWAGRDFYRENPFEVEAYARAATATIDGDRDPLYPEGA